MNSNFSLEEIEDYRNHLWRSSDSIFFDFDAFDLDAADRLLPLEHGRKSVTPPRSLTPLRSPTPPTPNTCVASTGSSSSEEICSLPDSEGSGEVAENTRSTPLIEVPFDSFQEFSINFNSEEETFEDSMFIQRVDLESLGHIDIRELPLADGVHATTGCQLWPASIALGRVLLSQPWLVEGKSVIELGAGCGFAGIVAAKFADKVLVTDYDRETVDNSHHNMIRNRKFWQQVGTAKDISTATLDWKEIIQHGWPASRRVDVLIGSDIIYGNWGCTVAHVADKVLHPDGKVILISALDRGGLEGFRETMEKIGFHVDLSHWVDNDKRFRLYSCTPTSGRNAAMHS